MKTAVVIVLLVLVSLASNAQLAVPTAELAIITFTYKYKSDTEKFEQYERANYIYLQKIKGLEEEQQSTVQKFEETSEKIFDFINTYNIYFNNLKMLLDTYESLESTIEHIAEIQNFTCIDNDYLYIDLKDNIVNQYNDFNALLELLQELFSTKFKAEDAERFEMLVKVQEDIKTNEKKLKAVVNAMNKMCDIGKIKKEKEEAFKSLFESL